MSELIEKSQNIEKKEMEKAYDPAASEAKWYAYWNDKGYFTPKIEKGKKPWVCIMPPPNVTGALHQGHALFVSIEDALTRWHRMKGEPTLWLPGTDHASISTEVVIEKLVWKEQKKTKNELGREAFLGRVWQWMDEYQGVIRTQMEKLGASADWTRDAFTMDAQRQRAVKVAFKRLFDAGLIYRAARIVNWCPGSLTVISDLEVEMKEEVGALWYVRYPVKGEEGRYVTVATTRPETMLGDTGVAVSPKDPRYTDLVGKMLILPLVGREIPIVADDGVEAEFGTGAVKVTPGHDPLDFEIGQRHNLPVINIMNPNASLNENGGAYAGLDRFVARKQVVADLEAQGFLVKTEAYTHSVPYSEKAGVPIEPLVKEQWWIKIGPLAEPALQAAYDGRIKFVPERFKKTYTDWMENLHDWAISRQLFWGHRVPVWFCDNCGNYNCTTEDTLEKCEKCGSTDQIWQDPDVLDTWFSSGMWPFSTLGWPDQTEDLDYFYPGDVLETGPDIIFFWVARMIMFGIFFMGEPPFHTVYLHGIVRDEKGQKMSKSKGNVIDPLENVKEYGSDALRFTLLTSGTPGVDVKLSFTKMADSRNFANKLWNATRFITLSGTDSLSYQPATLALAQTLADRWILSRYQQLVGDVTRLIEQFQLGEAGRLLYDFLWSEFCDWYIEVSKLRLNSPNPAEKQASQQVLCAVLEGALRLLHPFMPFVTEELWHNLPHAGEALIVAPWPTTTTADSQTDSAAVTSFEALQAVIRGIRNAKSEAKVESKRVAAIIVPKPEYLALFESERETIIRLAGVEATKLEIKADLPEAPKQAVSLVTDGATVYLPLAEMLDLEVERTRLSREIELARKEIEKSEGTLSNASFVERAPAAVVAKEREKQAATRERLARLEERLAELG